VSNTLRSPRFSTPALSLPSFLTLEKLINLFVALFPQLKKWDITAWDAETEDSLSPGLEASLDIAVILHLKRNGYLPPRILNRIN
jgi:hypothetical protein